MAITETCWVWNHATCPCLHNKIPNILNCWLASLQWNCQSYLLLSIWRKMRWTSYRWNCWTFSSNAFLLQCYACQPFLKLNFNHSDGFSVRFIQKNQSTFFTTVYDDGRKSADGAKTKWLHLNVLYVTSFDGLVGESGTVVDMEGCRLGLWRVNIDCSTISLCRNVG